MIKIPFIGIILAQCEYIQFAKWTLFWFPKTIIVNEIILFSNKRDKCKHFNASVRLFAYRNSVSFKMRRNLSSKEKSKILKDYDGLGKITQRAAAARLEIPQSTLSKILKARSEIETCGILNENKNRKRDRKGKNQFVEKALKLCLENVRSSSS